MLSMLRVVFGTFVGSPRPLVSNVRSRAHILLCIYLPFQDICITPLPDDSFSCPHRFSYASCCYISYLMVGRATV